jgi:hypothetical protein
MTSTPTTVFGSYTGTDTDDDYPFLLSFYRTAPLVHIIFLL